MSYIIASYLTEAKSLKQKAEAIAVGMTVGSWTDLPFAKQERLAPYLGKVIDIVIHERTDDGLERGIMKIGYPAINFTYDIPSFLTNLFGKLSMDGKIKLVDIEWPPQVTQTFPGPKFGIAGVREKLNVHDRPLLMSIFKSCIGLTLDELAEQFRLQIEGGVDLVKDDEIFFADDLAPLTKRIETYNELAKQTGRNILYAANLTGPVTTLVEKAKRAVAAGATCLLINVIPYGFDILDRLSRDPDINVPLMAHPALAGALYPARDYGIAAPLLLGKLMRLAGADLVLFPSPYGSVALPKDDALTLAKHLTCDNGAQKPAFPVPSAGIHPGLVPVLYEDFGNDHIVNAGGGIHGHPLGATGGGKAFRAAIDAVKKGIPLAQYDSEELRLALEKWGPKTS